MMADVIVVQGADADEELVQVPVDCNSGAASDAGGHAGSARARTALTRVDRLEQRHGQQAGADDVQRADTHDRPSR